MKIKFREEIFKQLQNKKADDEKLSKTLGKLIHVIVGLMDCISLSPDNAMLLYSKVKTFFLSSLKDKNNVFYEMEYLADKCQYDLISTLKEEFPSLKKSDIKLCSLISLGFPTHSLITIFRLTHDTTIYNKRERLRSRLEMKEGDNLMDFLKDKVELLRKQKETLYSHIFSSLVKKDYFYKNF
ncbi:MAG: hypothetical protein GX993_06755 [Bacteroidales bacterium]|nr:hypothetical protein [Bacteroidales bacterium]